MSNKSKQDIEDLLSSARAAMEAVDLPMENFFPFQPMAEQPTLLFRKPPMQKLSDLVPPSPDTPAPSKKQKLAV